MKDVKFVNNIKEFNEVFHSHIIYNNESKLKFKNIERIILYSIIYDGLASVIFVI